MQKLLLSILAQLFVVNVHCQTLIWSDEFNGSTLDPAKWNYETGTGINGDWGTGQQDAATDRPENVRIDHEVEGADGGALVITTQKENYNVPNTNTTRNFTSGRINTDGKGAWGPNHRLVVRAWPRDVRYPGQGFAFWMMPQEIPNGFDYLMWPQGGEIDVMEFVGSIPAANLGSVHYAPQWNNNEWNAGNHWHQGGYYSFKDEQNPLAFPQWLAVDLGEVTPIARVVLKWETAYARSYTLQVSDDGNTWSDVHSVTDSNGGTDEIDIEASGRYVRVWCTERGTEWGYSLYEVEVYELNETNNLAIGKEATSSSNENNTLTAAQAVDGALSTRWASGDVNSPAGGWPASPDDEHAGNSGFRTYGIDWYKDRLEFHVDSNVYHIHYFNDGGAFAKDGNNQAEVELENGKRVLKTEYSNRFSEWHPFEHKFYAILSAGVGGQNTYGGSIHPDAEFPCSVFIDWIRVYQLEEEIISDISDEEKVEIDFYPNPALSNIVFKNVNEGAVVTISGLNGAILARRVVKESQIDISDLKSGIYFLRIDTQSKPEFFKLLKH